MVLATHISKRSSWEKTNTSKREGILARQNKIGLFHPVCRVAVFLFLPISMMFNSMSGHADPQGKTVIKKGDLFPEIYLEPPEDPTHLSYLGLSPDKPFRIHDIKADLVLVEIMHINCSSCQKQAPIDNKLFSLIESKPESKGRIKMLAIAAGCLDVYIKQFVAQFNTPYPIFQDPKFAAYEAVGVASIPFTLYIKPDRSKGVDIVAGTHIGFNSDYKGRFREIQEILDVELTTIEEEGKAIQSKIIKVDSLLSEEELQAKIKAALAKEGYTTRSIRKVEMPSGKTVYTASVQKGGSERQIFSVMVGSPAPCDVCHEVHFIVLFEDTGEILQLIPVQLTKYGNEDWDEADIEKMRKVIIGRYLFMPFDFDPKIHAVSSATITSSVIFKSLEEEHATFKELKEQGLIGVSTDN